MSNYSESGIAVTRPPYQKERKLEQVELTDVPKSHGPISISCDSDDDNITALPQIGCIPSASYSETDLIEEHEGPKSQRSWHEKDMV
jgi:hypothetical protein